MKKTPKLTRTEFEFVEGGGARFVFDRLENEVEGVAVGEEVGEEE